MSSTLRPLSVTERSPGVDFDTEEKVTTKHEELKPQIAKQRPLAKYLSEMFRMKDLYATEKPDLGGREAGLFKAGSMDRDELRDRRWALFVYIIETINLLLLPMVQSLKEALGSMGNHAPLACLSQYPPLIYDYFKRLLAKVTSPLVDLFRERIVMSIACALRGQHDLVYPNEGIDIPDAEEAKNKNFGSITPELARGRSDILSESDVDIIFDEKFFINGSRGVFSSTSSSSSKSSISPNQQGYLNKAFIEDPTDFFVDETIFPSTSVTDDPTDVIQGPTDVVDETIFPSTSVIEEPTAVVEETFFSSTLECNVCHRKCACSKEKTKKKKFWTLKEDEILVEGVKRFGRGNWRVIQQQTEIKKTPLQLSDKYRNLLKKNNLQIVEERIRKKSLVEEPTDSDSSIELPRRENLGENRMEEDFLVFECSRSWKANEEIGTLAIHGAYGSSNIPYQMELETHLQKHLAESRSLLPSTPLTGRKYLKDKDSLMSTPVSMATQSVLRLQTLLATWKPHASDILVEIFNECANNPQDSIMSRLNDMGEIFCTAYSSKSSDDHPPDCQVDFAKKRLQLAQKLYFKAMENILLDEKKLPPNGTLATLLEHDLFHRSLIACCLEIVIFSYNSQRLFPWILDIFELQPYYFYRVIEVLIRGESGLYRDVVKHLNHIEEQILESLAWKHSSPLRDSLKASDLPIPTCEEVSLPAHLEPAQSSTALQVLQSPLSHPEFRRSYLKKPTPALPVASPVRKCLFGPDKSSENKTGSTPSVPHQQRELSIALQVSGESGITYIPIQAIPIVMNSGGGSTPTPPSKASIDDYN